MGGKKGAVLGSWIKEFCTLVFIQTIQAFIYAIIISFIVKMSFLDISDVDDRNASMGIICVIALTSVFKVEELVKKIFGIGNTKADVRGAMSSLAKTAIAWQFGKKVLDNGAKVAGGVKGIRDASKGRQKLKQRMNRDMSTYDDASEQLEDASTSMPTHTTTSTAMENDSTRMNSSRTGASAKSGKDTRDYNAMMDKYQDQLDELKKKRKDSIKQIWQGVGETAGALPGLAAGAIVGGADGNLDEALRGAAVGMGMGDTIGGAVATTAYDVQDIARSTPGAIRDAGAAVSKIRAAVKQQQINGRGIEKAKNYAAAYYKEATKNRVSERELQDMIKKANEAHADNAN